MGVLNSTLRMHVAELEKVFDVSTDMSLPGFRHPRADRSHCSCDEEHAVAREGFDRLATAKKGLLLPLPRFGECGHAVARPRAPRTNLLHANKVHQSLNPQLQIEQPAAQQLGNCRVRLCGISAKRALKP